MADHLLRHVDRQELAAVVHGEGMADELRRDHAGTRPRLDRLLFPGGFQLLHLLEQLLVDERALLGGSSHNSSLTLLGAAPIGNDHPAPDLAAIARLEALAELVPRRARVVAALGLAASAAHRIVGGVHPPAATGWADSPAPR